MNWSSTKLKTCASRDNKKKVKMQSTEWKKKIFANHVSDKGLVTRIYF